MQALNIDLITSWKIPLLFSLENAATMISKQNFRFPIHLTTEQFSTLPPSILNELWFREDSSVSGSCSHMAPSLHDRALTWICGWHGELWSQTMISGRVPEPVQCFPGQNHVCFYCSAASGFMESLDSITFCRWWNIQSLHKFTLRKIILKLLLNL